VQELLSLNLIHLFTFYLAVMFLLGTWRRMRQYHDVAQIVVAAPGRWPKLVDQLKKHWLIFATWNTLRPAALAIGLLLIQAICSRLIWPQAAITLRELLVEWWMLPIVLAFAAGMVALDVYFLFKVAQIDRKETEKYMDEAEHWLTSWKTPIISTVTFGFINPKKIVDSEVQKVMQQGKGLLNWALWWVSAQAGLRILSGLTLWLSWALFPGSTIE
jgi:hypothetical protein